jgi:hypothetical protein
MRISVSIMAHPDRRAQVAALRDQVGPVPVAWDAEGPPSRDPERLWRTAREAWRLYDPAAAWHLLLQDDAVPAPGLLAALPGALAHVPCPSVVSLYVGTGRPVPGVWHELARRGDEEGASWLVGPMVSWGVALLVPTHLIPELLIWGDRQRGIPDDLRVGRWAHHRKLEAWFPWPSLVNHPDGASLVGHGGGRTARRFLEGDARAVDWGGPVVRYGHARTGRT